MFKTTPLSIIVFVIVIVSQYVFFSVGTYSYSIDPNTPQEVITTYGLGSPIAVTTINQTTTYNINWLMLVLNLIGSYFIATLISHAFIKATKFKKPATIYGTAVLAITVITLIASIGVSKLYWGYFFYRPHVLEEFSEIKKVSAIIPFKTERDNNNERVVLVNDAFTIEKSLSCCERDQYYCLEERLLLALKQNNLLPSIHSKALSEYPPIIQLVQNTGIITKPDEGYHNSDLFQGIVIDTVNQSGTRVVFLGFSGRELSNDHYPYYELQFLESKESHNLSYVKGQKFYYDVAGIEGVEWYGFYPAFLIIGIIGIFVVIIIAVPFCKLLKPYRNV